MIIKPAVWITILFVWNLIVLGCYGWDKRKAIKNGWRIRESLLLLFGFLMGGIGAVCGMILFHHKISKWSFRILAPLGLVVTLAELYFLCKFGIFLF